MSQSQHISEAVRRKGSRHRGVVGGTRVELDPPSYRPLIYLIVLSVVFVTGYMILVSFAKREESTGIFRYRVPPVLVPIPANGIIRSLAVKNGESVEKGQIIATIERKTILKDGMDHADLKRQAISEREKGLKSRQDFILQKTELIQSRGQAALSALAEEESIIRKAASAVEVQKKEANDKLLRVTKLSTRKLTSLLDINLAKEQLFQFQKQLDDQNRALSDLESRRVSIKTEMNEQIKSVAQSAQSLDAEKLEIQKSLVELEMQSDLVIRAPSAGAVELLFIHEGDLVKAGQKMIYLREKQSELRAEFFVTGKVLPFLKSGDSVEVSVTAFPTEKYGTFLGNVTEIESKPLTKYEADALNIKGPHYRVIIDMKAQSYKGLKETLEFKDGMILATKFKLSRRNMWGWTKDILRRYLFVNAK